MLQWHYNEALTTGSVFFVLPPRGHTYSHAKERAEPDLSNYAKSTGEDAKDIFNISSRLSCGISWVSSASILEELVEDDAPVALLSQMAPGAAIPDFGASRP